MPFAPADSDGDDSWSSVILPENLAVVGSVNMDETTHGFSRKVLDRAFVLEFSDVDLTSVASIADVAPVTWPIEYWSQKYLRLSEYPKSDDADVLRAIKALGEVNEHLLGAQLQVGYRVRDEVTLFCVNARDCIGSFIRSSGDVVDPLDLAISMKVLPRLQGSGGTLRKALEGLLDWAVGSGDADTPTFPFCHERVALMLSRLDEAGFASFWL